jgi:curved DNA-binding protein CbpA
MPIDPYEALGLTKSATSDEIKKAYRKLVRSSHPDLHPDDAGAEARFKAITSAYDLLKDPVTRARFDTGEIDATGAERPQRQYYRDFAEAGDNPTNSGKASRRMVILPISSPKSCVSVHGRAARVLEAAVLPFQARICDTHLKCHSWRPRGVARCASHFRTEPAFRFGYHRERMTDKLCACVARERRAMVAARPVTRTSP